MPAVTWDQRAEALDFCSPQSFSVNRRNAGHWDVCNDLGRAFCIRGEPGKVYVRDERKDGRPFPRHNHQFKTVSAAMTWCAEQWMWEIQTT